MKTALVVIARNESRCIGRCVASARAWVDEVVVLDTGSSDDTVEQAKAAGARVEFFAWVDDFSAARNAALDCTDADWRLVLDADEWLVDGGELLPALGPPLFVGQIAVINEFDDAGLVRTAVSWISRLLPKGVRYTGRIHEQVAHDLPTRRMPGLKIGHDGYRDAQNQQGKGERNRWLLAKALAAAPDDAYLHYQSGKNHEVHGDMAEAQACYAQAHALLTASPAGDRFAVPLPDNVPYRHDLVSRWLYCLQCTARFEEGLHLAQVELDRHPQSPDFFFALGGLLLGWASTDSTRAEALLPMIESSWLRCLEIGEAPDVEGAVQGRGSDLAAHNLAVFHRCLGHGEQAEAFERMASDLADRSRP